jgi:diketogulonate reductase-like aldo/keto reductase
MYDIILNNKIRMPVLGWGTYKIENEQAYRCAPLALQAGYRRIDTATLYNNEAGIGRALAKSDIPRENIFITSKLWTDVTSYKQALSGIDKMLNNLKTAYLDLLLIHWPGRDNSEVWRAMEDAVKAGKVRSIGVSNFKEHHLERLLADCSIPPVLNQVELHPLFQQKPLREYCEKHNITVEAWSPLLRGAALRLPKLMEIAQKHGKTASQVILRFLIEQGVTAVPKTVSYERMAENINIFDFQPDKEDMAAIAALDQGQRQYRDPDNHGF